MNRGRVRPAGGYTIVETLIFLAVSAAMFVAAMTFLNGQQSKAEFSQSVHDFESSLQSIANNVSNGYYADVTGSGGKLNCTVVGGAINFGNDVSGDTQGAHQDCIYAGQAVQFGPADHGMAAGAGYTLLTIAGKRVDVSNQPVSDIKSAGLAAASDTQLGWPDATTSNPFEYGVTVGCVFYATTAVIIDTSKQPCKPAPAGSLPSGAINFDTLSFVSTFQGTDVDNTGVHSGNVQVDLLVPTTPAVVGRSSHDAATLIDSYSNAVPQNWLTNPAGGVYICLDSGGSSQYGLIKLGGNTSRFTTSTIIGAGGCN